MPRFATKLIWMPRSSRVCRAGLAGHWAGLALAGSVLSVLAACSGTIQPSAGDGSTGGPEDGLAGTRLQGSAADPGPSFGVQRSGVSVRLWTLPPQAGFPDKLVEIFDQPRSAGDASEAAEPWRQRGFLAATIALADVAQLEQALATLPQQPASAAGGATTRVAENAAEDELSIEAATRKANQDADNAGAADAKQPVQPPLPAPAPAAPARSIAPARVESLPLRPSAEPAVILRGASRGEPWAMMQVSGGSQQPSRVPAGQPVLLGRVWPRPGAPLPARGFSALMRLELTAALVPDGVSRALRADGGPLPLSDGPLVFDLPHHRALVLSVPVEATGRRASRSGPDVEKPPSLAQALLTTATGERMVLVLIPTLPGVFTLQELAPAASAAGVSSPASRPPERPSASQPEVKPELRVQPEVGSVSPLMDR
jgi:hypothetical protein